MGDMERDRGRIRQALRNESAKRFYESVRLTEKHGHDGNDVDLEELAYIEGVLRGLAIAEQIVDERW